MGSHKLLVWNTLESQSVNGVTPYEVIDHGEFVMSFFGEALLVFILALGDFGGIMTPSFQIGINSSNSTFAPNSQSSHFVGTLPNQLH